MRIDSMRCKGEVMRKAFCLTVLLILFCTTSLAQLGLPAVHLPGPRLIKAGRVLDVRGGKYLLDQGILTEGQTVKEIGPWETVSRHAPKDAIRIDLSQATLLPGIIDCHAHLLLSMDGRMDGGQNLTASAALYSPSFRTLIGAHNARQYLEA